MYPVRCAPRPPGQCLNYGGIVEKYLSAVSADGVFRLLGDIAPHVRRRRSETLESYKNNERDEPEQHGILDSAGTPSAANGLAQAAGQDTKSRRHVPTVPPIVFRSRTMRLICF